MNSTINYQSLTCDIGTLVTAKPGDRFGDRLWRADFAQRNHLANLTCYFLILTRSSEDDGSNSKY